MPKPISAVFIVLLLISIFLVTAVVLYFKLDNLLLSGYMNISMFLILGFTHKRFKTPETLQAARDKAKRMGKSNIGCHHSKERIQKRVKTRNATVLRKQEQNGGKLYTHSMKGLTRVEYFGEEKAAEISKKRSATMKETIANRVDFISPLKGRTWEEISGVITAQSMRENLSRIIPIRLRAFHSKRKKEGVAKLHNIPEDKIFFPSSIRDHKFARKVLIEKSENFDYIEENNFQEYPIHCDKSGEVQLIQGNFIHDLTNILQLAQETTK